MRFFALATALAMTAQPTSAQGLTGIDWQLLAIDGQVVDIPARLRVTENGNLSGNAPCNSFTARNAAALPELKLEGIRATRMVCERQAEERVFFEALAAMDRLALDGSRNVVLTGADGRSMEFVLDLMNSLTVCKTCANP